MPYIKKAARAEIDPALYEIKTILTRATSGDVNYLVTSLLLSWLGTSPRYQDFNNAIGVLECAKLELYRRMIAPYEDVKIAENGDVY